MKKLKLSLAILDKVGKIIREKGLITFMREFFNFFIRELYKIESKIPSKFYIHGFHKLYFYSHVWKSTYWLGIPVFKLPLDLWVYQEIIYETKPDFIIETGTSSGGSALFFASICDLIGHGEVITIDKEDRDVPPHPRMIKIVGNSVSEEVIER